ncbi:glycine cleavage T C-terminal barrel domain-containing protein [Bailinhaonella thermotolerans]|uniref:Aminomethyltransferase C-terminal domain-containing protein n=1 Tax=Bailinhaonella thermotolerans TaxID=1070861 RepID=A0A3A4A326_9ACTN|nr:hypothetical protein D5H75_34855 [Bailinhaonella thermotolerans]
MPLTGSRQRISSTRSSPSRQTIRTAGRSPAIRTSTHAVRHVIVSCRSRWPHRAPGGRTALPAGPDERTTQARAISPHADERPRLSAVARKLVSITLDDPDVQLRGGELLLRDGSPAGYVTSAAHGHPLGRTAGPGYVDGAEGAFPVDVAGGTFSAQVQTKAPYDPASSKVKA